MPISSPEPKRKGSLTLHLKRQSICIYKHSGIMSGLDPAQAWLLIMKVNTGNEMEMFNTQIANQEERRRNRNTINTDCDCSPNRQLIASTQKDKFTKCYEATIRKRQIHPPTHTSKERSNPSRKSINYTTPAKPQHLAMKCRQGGKTKTTRWYMRIN